MARQLEGKYFMPGLLVCIFGLSLFFTSFFLESPLVTLIIGLLLLLIAVVLFSLAFARGPKTPE